VKCLTCFEVGCELLLGFERFASCFSALDEPAAPKIRSGDLQDIASTDKPWLSWTNQQRMHLLTQQTHRVQ